MRHGRLCAIGTAVAAFFVLLAVVLRVDLPRFVVTGVVVGIIHTLVTAIRKPKETEHSTLCYIVKWVLIVKAADLVGAVASIVVADDNEARAVAMVVAVLALVVAIILNKVLKRPTITIIDSGRPTHNGLARRP